MTINTLTISPLPRSHARRIPIGFLQSDGTLVGEDNPKIVYSLSAATPLRIARRCGGTALVARTAGSSRWVKFNIGDTTYFPGVTSTDVDELIRWRDYCYGEGISARSIQAMAFYLMRAGLAGYFDVSRGVGIPFHRFPVGSRMQAKPGVYRSVIQSDIRAAYLWGIGRFTPARAFHMTGSRTRPETVAGIPGAWALVKFRYARKPSWGSVPAVSDRGSTVFPDIQKNWSDPVLLSSFDIEAGILSGAFFKVLKSWLPHETVGEPFSTFMHHLWNLRGEFPAVAKQGGNTLWGSFCASSNLHHVTFSGGKGSHRIVKIPTRPPLCAPIGYSVLAKLRSRLFLEGFGNATIHAHTDGVIAPTAQPEGADAPGEWRIVSWYQMVEILSPSWYRTIDVNGVESFKTAGRSEIGDHAARIFAHYRDKQDDNRSRFARAMASA